MSVADEEEQESLVDEEEQESLCSRTRTRTCAVCGMKMADATLRRSSSRSQNHYILMMSISLAGQIEEKIARTRAVGLARGSRKFCHIHVVHAAQYLLAETVTAGNEISHFKDPKARGRTAYVTDGDIPPNLVSALNKSAENRVLITSRDVSSFINDAFKRYYETVLWPVTEEAYLTGEAGQSESVPKVGMGSNARDNEVAVEEEMISVADDEQDSLVDEEEEETLCARKSKRTCVVCSKKMADSKLRRSSSRIQYRYILMMSISLAGQIEEKIARTKVEGLSRSSRKFCHIHVVHAAQYLLAETVTAGNEISHFEDPKARGRTAYVTDGDIPPNLVSALNRSAENRVLITSRDVSSFINDAFKRYYATSLWPVKDEIDVTEDVGSVPKVTEREGGVAGETADFEVKEELMTNEEEQGSLQIADESESDDMSDDSSVSWKTPVKESNPTALQQYYLVKGSSLVQLFEYCPQCGHKLSGMQLNAAGTTAVVKFLCDMCSAGSSLVQRWYSVPSWTALGKLGTCSSAQQGKNARGGNGSCEAYEKLHEL